MTAVVALGTSKKGAKNSIKNTSSTENGKNIGLGAVKIHR
jgi:hypothetical protein